MIYLLILLLIILSPLILSWIVVGIYMLIFGKDSYETSWIKTGGTLLGLRYSLKILTEMLIGRRRR